MSLERLDGRARVRVRDTGVGMRPELLPQIFERFRQGDSSSRRVQGGLGLGLTIAQHIVDLHDGRISAWSEGEGRGSTFTIELPLTPAARDRRGAAPGGSRAGASARRPARAGRGRPRGHAARHRRGPRGDGRRGPLRRLGPRGPGHDRRVRPPRDRQRPGHARDGRLRPDPHRPREPARAQQRPRHRRLRVRQPGGPAARAGRRVPGPHPEARRHPASRGSDRPPAERFRGPPPEYRRRPPRSPRRPEPLGSTPALYNSSSRTPPFNSRRSRRLSPRVCRRFHAFLRWHVACSSRKRARRRDGRGRPVSTGESRCSASFIRTA